MSIVEELRQNDPAMKSICILLHFETSDAALAQALEQNPFVTDIVLDLERVQQTDWGSLLHVISTRANLGKVELQDADDPEDRTEPALVRSILRAMQHNTAIRNVGLAWFRLFPTDTSTFVDNASSIRMFSLQECDMNPAERQQGPRGLAVALQRNTNIETLKLSWLEDIYAIPILEGLRSNTAVKTFIFNPSPFRNLSDATSHALHQLLESTTSIQKFELQEVISENLASSVAQAITSSECVSELVFKSCQFNDQSSIAKLRSILQNKRNLTSLCLHGCHYRGGQLHEDIISMLLRPDSLLQCFEFQSRGSLENVERVFPGIQFKNLLEAIQKSKLERFEIGIIHSQQHLQALTGSIPLMHITELDVAFEGQILRENANPRQNLLLAIKNNFSLRSVKGEMQDDDLFGTAEDKQRLAFYANRNESLDQWVDHPETVEQKVWPDALGLAERAGPSALFRGLRSVLGSDYVHLPGVRKRKCTQHYTPS